MPNIVQILKIQLFSFRNKMSEESSVVIESNMSKTAF